ncbi:MAG: assimilatory sulfite reductase (NADPH) flavoprotein subunit [Candidatus Thiodiazotropha sp. (ex Lucina pensylvanica)]|nr:assimilatory sulfite reductase (NADPH) flavoprotein subunit [Candidatus Thiodiazotropha sp. (ex Lucina pensylvanica)]
MDNTVKTLEDFSNHPLERVQLSRLLQAVEGLNKQQLTWASGYLAGLGVLEPTVAKAPDQVPGMTILYATQGGNARSVAEALAENATAQGFAPRLVSADSYRPRDLTKEQVLVVVISTQGEGEPPESAYDLFKYLRGDRAPRLEELRYAVFGLGDSSYEQFCQAARELDELLGNQGARSLLDRIDADVEFQQAATNWQDRILTELGELQPLDQARIIPLQRESATPRHDRNNPFRAALLARHRITTADAVCNVQHISLEIDLAVIRYRPGDALGLYFQNDPALIEEMLALAGLAAEAPVSLDGERMTLGQALEGRLELTQLHPSVVKAWAALAGDQGLDTLSREREELRTFVQNRQFVDLLQNHPADVDAQGLVEILHAQQPRLYSIASSQTAYEDEVHLTVAALRYRGHGRDHLGGASGYLTQRISEGDDLGVYVVENPSFRLPASADIPIIMIGAGTGIAPYRAFLQEREALGSAGDGWLVFGNRHFHRDFLYQTDWLAYRKAGLLNRISLAFSRDEGACSYVQARLYEERAELYRWLWEGAHLYVCGGVEMAQGVHQSLLAIVQDQGGLAEEAAVEYTETLREQGRYQRDIY